ncbi:MAG: hypothetical protein WBO17_07410 [Sphingorhabdus sp.]
MRRASWSHEANNLAGLFLAEFQVTCIKSDMANEDRRIACLGGRGWIKTADMVILEIQLGLHDYWTLADGVKTAVVVARHPRSMCKYLQTQGDEFPSNRLLDLIDCL